MQFRVVGLDPALFRHLVERSDPELARLGVRRVIADRTPGFPDRIEMRDAEPGERLLLLNYTHQPANNPYRASHAIFVREGAARAYDRTGEVPTVMRSRLISLRAFDVKDEMIAADVLDGWVLDSGINEMLADAKVAYLHAHYAKWGCYAARIERAA